VQTALDPQRLTPGEVAFLWCIYLLNKSGIEQWEESRDEVFPTMPLFTLLASQAEEREELVRSIRGIGYGRADARHTFDASGENYAVVDLIQDDGSGPCRAFYSYYVPQAGTGLELVVLGRPDLAVRIRRMREGEYKDLEDVLHRMSQPLNKNLRVQ
jgi:hypothetical protein